jgi:type IV secretory pathway VirB9-like protein
MNLKKFLLVGLLESSIMLFPSISSAQDGIVDYPAYTDGTAQVFEYNPYRQYEIYTRVGYVTDIQLRPGEEVQKIATGNSSQWAVDTDFVAGIEHVYLKSLAPGLRTNIIINTSQRSYRLIANSTNDSIGYIVIWSYPKEDYEEGMRASSARWKKQMEDERRFQKIYTTTYDRSYVVKKNKDVKSDYIPLAVFDDGVKTYIELSNKNIDNMPVFYYFDEYDKKKLQLINYRLKNGIIELDKVMHNMKIAFSQKSYLIVERGSSKHTIPNPKDIDLGKVNRDKIYSMDDQQASEVPLTDSYVTLKEREKAEKMNQMKELLRESRSNDSVRETSSFSEEDVDRAIEKLESEIRAEETSRSSSNSSNQQPADSDPAIQLEIQEIYK